MARTIISLSLALGVAKGFIPSSLLPLRAAGRLTAVAIPGPLAEAPDVGNLPLCPATLWNDDFADMKEAQDQARAGSLSAYPLEWTATPEDNAAGAAFFKANKEEAMARLQEHGCIWFRGFDMMKTPEGFRSFYDALDLPLCLDPIHTSGLRKVPFHLPKRDAMGTFRTKMLS